MARDLQQALQHDRLRGLVQDPPQDLLRQPAPKPVAEKPREAPPPLVASGVQTVTVTPDESGMRVDRFLEARFPGLSFSHIQRVIRKGELRVNGKRVEPKDRLEAGQNVRIPPRARRCAASRARRAARPTRRAPS